jgi:hypothetical protein
MRHAVGEVLKAIELYLTVTGGHIEDADLL